jgi:hypothetical protein
MPCKWCGSFNQKKFSAEIGIHFPGLENIDKPAVWVFPELVVCFNCGSAEFAIPEPELRQLEQSDFAAAGWRGSHDWSAVTVIELLLHEKMSCLSRNGEVHFASGEGCAAMARKLVWIESQNFEGFGCSQCQWVFNPSGPFIGRALDKMKEAYEAERDKEFTAHVCANSQANKPNK